MATQESKRITASANQSQNASKSKKPAVDEQEVRQESSKAANAAIEAQKGAKELKEAAASAGDPAERQKLTEQAVDAQIEAESFGKTAKYLRSGAFQGLAVGTGIGVAPGATLGAVTGTLVGGVTSTITGGIGGGIGAAAGAIHCPMVDFSKLAGKGMRKVTGFLPQWAASDEQKKSLEKMLGQVNEQDMPDEGELKELVEEGGGAKADEGWMKSIKEMMPNLPSWAGGKRSKEQEDDGEQQLPHDSSEKEKSGEGEENKVGDETSPTKPEIKERKKPRKLEVKSGSKNDESNNTQEDPKRKPQDLKKENEDLKTENEDLKRRNEELEEKLKELSSQNADAEKASDGKKKKPRKLQSRSEDSQAHSSHTADTKSQPPKLEERT